MRSGYDAPVLQGHLDTVTGVCDTRCACLADERAATRGEHVLDHGSGVRVLAGQHTITRGHQRDRNADLGVAAREFGAGDTGADHDEMLGRLGQFVDVTPRQDAFAVRARRVEHSRRTTGGEQHDVRLDVGRDRAVRVEDVEPMGARRLRRRESRTARHQRDAVVCQAIADVGGLLRGQRLDAVVHRAQVDIDLLGHHADADLRRVPEHRDTVARRDQRLARDAVGQHARAADSLALDQRDVRAELHRDQRGLVAGRAATDNRNTRHAHDCPEDALASVRSPAMTSSSGLYAAYGSNMDPEQMLERCPHSPAAGTGWLNGWRLTFGGEEHGWDGALAMVVPDPGSQVFVALYDLSPQDQGVLDYWESADTGLYNKIKLRVATLDGEVLAWVYILDGYEGGLPSARYLGLIAEAAQAAGAP